MVAPALDDNPRRIKQFFNVFRLKIYIFQSYLAWTADEPGRITLEQLGKIAAIGLRWPHLLGDLNHDPDLLRRLERAAKEPEGETGLGATDLPWHQDFRLRQLLASSPEETMAPSPCFEKMNPGLFL
jgi:hypothetical protein